MFFLTPLHSLHSPFLLDGALRSISSRFLTLAGCFLFVVLPPFQGDDAGPTSPEFRRMCGLRTIMRSKSAVAGASHAANTWVHISRGTTVQKPDGRNPNSPKEDNGGSSKTVVIALSVSLGTLVVVVAVLATVSYFRRRRRGPARTYLAGPSIQGEEEDEGEAEDRPLFSHRGNQSSHQNYGLAVKL